MTQQSNRPRIMICEDEMVIGVHLAAEVEAWGCEAIGPFATVGEAMAAVRMQDVDAAILDVELADGACTPLARALREAEVPMIVLSGLQMSSPPPEFAGVEWLVKPADERRLRRFCDEIIAARGETWRRKTPEPFGTSAQPGDLLP